MGQTQKQVRVVPKNNAPANAPAVMVQFLTSNNPTNYLLAWSDAGSNMWSTSCPAVQGQTSYAWTKPIQIPGGTSGGPALAESTGGDWVAWKGQGTDTRIFLSLLKGTWAQGVQISGIGTSAAPALTAVGGYLVLAWKGIGDNTIYWSQSNNTTGGTPSNMTGPDSPDAAWGSTPATQTPLQTGRSTAESTHTPALAACYPDPAPAAGVLPGYVLCAWKGQQTPHDRIYAAVYNLSLNNAPTWTPIPIPHEFRTSVGPAVACDASGSIWLAWKGESDDSIWTAYLGAAYWQGLERSANVVNNWVLPGGAIPVVATVAQPALTDLSGGGGTEPDLLLAWQGHKSPFELWVGPLAGLAIPL